MQQQRFIDNSTQLNMFRAIILPIFRSTRLCVTACGIMRVVDFYVVERRCFNCTCRIELNEIGQDRMEGFVGTGWSWLRIGTDGSHLWVR